MVFKCIVLNSRLCEHLGMGLYLYKAKDILTVHILLSMNDSLYVYIYRRGYAYWVEWPTRRIVRASLNNESDVVILHESTKPTDEERFGM